MKKCFIMFLLLLLSLVTSLFVGRLDEKNIENNEPQNTIVSNLNSSKIGPE